MSKGLFAGVLILALLLSACGGNRAAAPVAQPVAVEAQLRQQLLADLAARGIDPDKAPSRAPHGSASRTLIYSLGMGSGEPSVDTPQSVSFSMFTMIAGDCDSNGEVNITDITRLSWWITNDMTDVIYGDPAQNYGQQYYPTIGNCFSDGDRNSVVTIGDLSPISAHYGEKVAGWRVYIKPPGAAAFKVVEDPDQPGQPLFLKASDFVPDYAATASYTFQVTQPGTTQFYVVPVDGVAGQEGTPSQTFTYVSNKVPLASFTVSDNTPDTSQVVELDAAASSDPDGGPLTYSWYVEQTVPADSGASAQFIGDSATAVLGKMRFPRLGTYEVSLNVTDSRGAYTQAAAQQIVVDTVGGGHSASWNWSTLPDGFAFLTASSQDNSLPLDLQEVAGRAAVVNTGEGDAWFTSTPPDGSAWTAPAHVLVFTPGASLAEVAGRPAMCGVHFTSISELNQIGGTLQYALALDADGSSWPAPVDLDRCFFSYGLVNYQGQPCPLRTHYPFGSTFEVWSASDPDGSDMARFSSYTLQDGEVDGYRFVLLQSGADYYVVDVDKAAEVYHSTNLQVWTKVATIANTIGTGSSLLAKPAIVNGRLALVWSASEGVQYTMALDAAATQWIPLKQVNTPRAQTSQQSNQAYDVGVASIDGVPAIAYTNDTGELRLIRATNSNGTAWDRAGAEMLSDYGTPRDCDLAVIGGHPAVVVFDASTQQVEYGWQP